MQQKAVKGLLMKIFWAILLLAVQRAFLIQVSLSSAITSETIEKGNMGWESLVSGFNIGRKCTSCTLVVSQSAYNADVQQR